MSNLERVIGRVFPRPRDFTAHYDYDRHYLSWVEQAFCVFRAAKNGDHRARQIIENSSAEQQHAVYMYMEREGNHGAFRHWDPRYADILEDNGYDGRITAGMPRDFQGPAPKESKVPKRKLLLCKGGLNAVATV